MEEEIIPTPTQEEVNEVAEEAENAPLETPEVAPEVPAEETVEDEEVAE